MDEHAARVCAPLLAGWTMFKAGRASLLDLERLAEQVAAALDNANAPLPGLLAKAASDLESAFYTIDPEKHSEEAQRILAPAFERMGVSIRRQAGHTG